MNVFHLLKNPIIKTVGITLILYFALFSSRSPDSLRNRLSPQNIKQDLGEIKEKSKFIVTNIKTAQSLAVEKAEAEKLQNKPAFTSIEDAEIGSGEDSVICGSEIEISYGIYTIDKKQLDFVNSEKLTIGTKSHPLIEKNIIGMKLNGTRYINIPSNFKTDDIILAQILKLNNGDLRYQIDLKSLKQDAANKNIVCNF